jgi:sterol 14-demethylase
MISKSLTKAAFRSYVSKIEDEVNAYVDEFWKKDSDVIDFSEAIGEITIRTSTRFVLLFFTHFVCRLNSYFSSCLQGSDIRNQVHMGWARYMDDLDKALTPLSFFYPNLPLPTFRKRNNARKQIGMIIKNIISARRENPNREVENDIIEVLMV